MKTFKTLIIFSFFLFIGCASYIKFSGIDIQIDAAMEESMSIAALVITYHQINGIWPTSEQEVYSYFSENSIDPNNVESQKAIDNCLFYAREIKQLQFNTNSDDSFFIKYDNYKNRDVRINLSYLEKDENKDDKQYIFSAHIQIPSNTGELEKSVIRNSTLSEEQNEYFAKLIDFLITGMGYATWH